MTAKPDVESIPRAAVPSSREVAPRPALVTAARILPRDHVERNPGMPLDLDFVRSIRVNRSAVERRAATIPTRRTVKKEWQAAWLLRAITLIDLTTLVRRRHAGKRAPVCAPRRGTRCATISSRRSAFASSASRSARCASTTRWCDTAVEALDGFGHSRGGGVDRFSRRPEPDRAAHRRDPRVSGGAGAREIDIVITRAHVLTGNYEALYDEVQPLPRGVRRRAHEGDPRHRRAGDARQRRAREHGRDAGRAPTSSRRPPARRA